MVNNSFIASSGKEEHSRLVPPGWGVEVFGEEFYSNASKVGVLRVSVCARGKHSFNLASGS